MHLETQIEQDRQSTAGEELPVSRLHRPTWNYGGMLVAIHLLVTFAVRPGPRWGDAIKVLNYARDFPDVPLDHHALRIGNIFPARLFQEIFGYGQVAYYAWPFLTGILLVVATFALATLLFGRWTGFAAGLLVVFHPILVDTEMQFPWERMTSWHLLPDIPSTALLTAGLALLVYGASLRSDADARERRQTAVFLLAGLCFGYAYLVRELSVFVFPVIAGVLAAWRLPLRRWFQVAAPMLACLALEFAVAAAVHGHPLARLRIGAEHGSSPPGVTRLDALLRFPRAVIGYPQTMVVLATLVLMILGAIVIRRRGHLLMLGWFMAVWLPLTLVSGLLNPNHIRLNPSLMRYWIPVIPPLCIGAAATVAAALRSFRRWAADRGGALSTSAGVVSTTVAVGALALWCVPMIDDIVSNPRDRGWNAIRAYLAQHDDAVDEIITTDRDARTLEVYQYPPIGGDRVWNAQVRELPERRNLKPSPPGQGTGVLLWTPELSRRPPGRASGWELVVDRPELKLYREADARPLS